MQEITPQRKPQPKIQPAMDFDIDDFDFKPVTKGLGFHQEKQLEKKTVVSQRPKIRTRTERVARVEVPRETPSVELPRPREIQTKGIEKENIISKKTEAKIVPARLGVQGTGFVFDLFIILGTQVLINAAFLKLSGLSNIVQFLEFTWVEQTIFFSFIFLFYFSIFDLVASPGKRIFSLRLSSTSSKKVTVDQTLIRSVVTLLSFITVFMPLIFDFQGKLSDTKVVEDVSA
ncbi:MAG: hypothetical protein CME70_07115 [Halobacteriovorax sp.]|nr:hypothetical protein [Halobacteriovorax sp.]|tara:strand:+ start:419642 stop:420334 length:693 start_codon:yes stop_codon:yes gene_type:complete